jgi:hypothetical protein
LVWKIEVPIVEADFKIPKPVLVSESLEELAEKNGRRARCAKRFRGFAADSTGSRREKRRRCLAFLY